MNIQKKALCYALTLMLALSMLITPAFANEDENQAAGSADSTAVEATGTTGNQGQQDPAVKDGEVGGDENTQADTGNGGNNGEQDGNGEDQEGESPADQPAVLEGWVPSLTEPDTTIIKGEDIKNVVIGRDGGRTGDLQIISEAESIKEAIADGSIPADILEKYREGDFELWNGYAYEKVNQTVTTGKDAYSVAFGSKPFSLGAKASGGGKLSYESSNSDIVSVDSKGTVSIKDITKNGPVTITVTASDTEYYKASEAKTVKISVTRPAAPRLKVTRAGKRKIKLTWSAVPGAVRYKVYCPQFAKKQRNGSTTRTYITSKRLKRGRRYKCAVKAVVTVGKVTYESNWTPYVTSPKVR